jgi:hypothetical protein
MSSPNFKLGLNGKVTPRSMLGFMVGTEIEMVWEVTNLDTRTFPGGQLAIVMASANGQFVQFLYSVKPLLPNEKLVIERDQNGNPLTSNILAPGFTLFSAQMNNVNIYSPPTQYRHPGTSFLSILGKSREEVYAIFGLIIASIGLVTTSIVSLIQLLHDFMFI